MPARLGRRRQLDAVGRHRSSGVLIPNPWQAGAKPVPERAAILRSPLNLREKIFLLDPWLPIPQNSCCYAFGEEGPASSGRRTSLPVGPLVRVHRSLPRMRWSGIWVFLRRAVERGRSSRLLYDV